MRSRAIVLFLLASTSTAVAQEGFRTETVDDRPFDFSDTYYFDILTFLHPEDWQAEWDAARTGHRATVGSVRTNEFYIDQQLKADVDVGKWFHLRTQLFQREDFDSRFLRIINGGDIDLTDRVTVGSFTTILPNKEQMDIGFSASYLVNRRSYLSVSYLLVDALFNTKNEGNDRLSGDPTTLKIQGNLQPLEDWLLSFRVGRNFPLRIRFGDDAFDFDHRKSFYRTRLMGRLSDRWSLVMRLEGENGERVRRYDDPADPDNMEQERDQFRFRLELTKRLLGSFYASGGFDYFYLYEASLFSSAPAETRRILLREATVYGLLRFPVPFTEKFTFRPGLYISQFNDRDEFPGDPARSDRQRGLRSKVATAIEYRLPGRIRLFLNATFRLEERRFGGGNIQVQMTF